MMLRKVASAAFIAALLSSSALAQPVPGGGGGGGGGGGTGDVTGPGSSTSGNFPSFNGTGGKTLQDSTYGPNSFAPSGVVTVVTGSNPTTNAASWAAFTQYTIAGSGRTITIPATSTLSANGGLDIDANTNPVTLQANAADTITWAGVTTSTGGSISLPAGLVYRVSTDAAGKLYVSGKGVQPCVTDVCATANRWYNTQYGPTGTGTAVGSTTTQFFSFTIDKPATIDTVGGRTATVDAAGHWRAGIYLEDPTTHKPTGSALCTTSDIALTSGSNTGACAATIPAAGRVWIAFQTDSATGALIASTAGAYSNVRIGVASQSNLSGSGTVGGTEYKVTSTTYGTFPAFPASTLTELGSTGLYNIQVQIHINTVP